MTSFNASRSYDNLTGGADSTAAFYDEISSIQDQIRTFNANILKISELHTRSLNSMDETAQKRSASQLEELMDETSNLSNDLKRRVKALQALRRTGPDAQARAQQVRQPRPIKGAASALTAPSAWPDRIRQIKIRRVHTRVSTGRARVPRKVQAAHRAPDEDRSVHALSYQSRNIHKERSEARCDARGDQSRCGERRRADIHARGPSFLLPPSA